MKTVLNDVQIKMTKELLMTVIKNERFIEYNELAKKIDPDFEPINVAHNVGEISKLCFELGLPLLSAKVVSKGKCLVGKGFFGLYELLGISRDGLSENELFHRELKRIHECTDWHKLAGYLNIDIDMRPTILASIIPEQYSDEEARGIPEGGKKRIYVNRYERDAYNRRQCIDHYKQKNDGKIQCQICDFDFGKVYGDKFINTIHVHHIVPISKIGPNYKIRPSIDLIPVCPNCHLVLHSKTNGVYTIEEVKGFINNK